MQDGNSASKEKLKVFVAKHDKKPKHPALTLKKDLNQVLGGKSYAGFTGATGGATLDADVISWKLKQ